jgi:N-acetylmuramoyl-L-alanine amidase-like protein
VPFDIDIQHWPTISAFTAYLQGVPRPSWCKGITNHNTYIPNETQWHGRASVESCMQTYIAKGWSAGPHLFLAAEAPNPADTGIWQLTPLAHIGVHAGACNADHLGIENVGDFNARPPSPAQYTLLLAVNRAILERWMLTPANVNVHNECMVGRTCPGKYLTGTQIRASLSGAWPPAQASDPFARWGDVGKPSGIAAGFAVPRAWLVNQVLGKCVAPETYSTSGRYSVTEFEHGLITYFKARNVALVEKF